jgi:beta-galactosidase
MAPRCVRCLLMRLFCLLLAFISSGLLFAAREEIPLVTGWKFIREDIGIGAVPNEKWSDVSLPHTWNARDGQNGRAADPGLLDGYYRGGCWYAIVLPRLGNVDQKRVYVRFEAAATVTDVFIGEQHVGQHRGAFTAFVFELTPYLRPDQPNTLHVRVDNGRFPDVAPLSGDYTIHGGLYRPVTLLVLDRAHFAFEHGSRGVFFSTPQLSADTAVAEVRAIVENASAQPQELTVHAELRDSAKALVAQGTAPAKFGARERRAVAQELSLSHPHRWHGRKDPYLYELTVSLRRGDQELDRIVQRMGFRTVAIDEEHGFLLNGEPYPIHGVSRHQDRADCGWAVTPEQEREDLRIIAEMGATAVRLPTYAQSERIHAFADELGLLLCEEIPNVERIPSLPEFFPNLQQQLRETICQGYNSPAVAFWGLFNEAKAVWLPPFGAPPERYHDQLRRDVESLDRSRLITGASWLRHHDPLHDTVPYPAFNQYPGWKYDAPDDMKPIVDLIYANHGRRIALSEYGAGASIHHHAETGLGTPKNTESPFHPEEWQAIVHETNWKHLAHNPKLWGTFVWVMFDFTVDARNEGDRPGFNDKGLVTADRKTRKDAYYFYQANWTDAPMVYLTSRRMTTRRVNPVREIKLYSNCTDVELVVNGVSLGKKQPDEIRVLRWENVALNAGANRVEAIGRRPDGQEVRDAVSWFVETRP